MRCVHFVNAIETLSDRLSDVLFFFLFRLKFKR